MRQSAKYLLLALLTVHLVWRGIIPALTTIDTDFPNYYVSSRLALEGRFDRAYDDVWFQQQIRAFGIEQMGKFSPYPPVTAFIMMPLASLRPLNALRAWTVINLGFLVCTIVLLSKLLRRDLLWSTLIILLSGHAIVNNFRFGQFYLILTFFILWALWLWQRDRKTPAAILLGIGAAVKYFPLLFLYLSVARKEWKMVLTALGTVLALVILSVAALGIGPCLQFTNSILLPHLSGNIQNRFSMNFQSWNSLLARLLLFDSALNPNPVFNSSIAYFASLIAVYVSVLTLLVFGLQKAAETWGDKALNVEFALLSICGIVLFPASATYHFLLISVPVAILLSPGMTAWSIEQTILAILYTCIGFIPYSLFNAFDGKGLLSIFAYPRLFLTTAIFVTALVFVARFKPQQSSCHQGVQIA